MMDGEIDRLINGDDLGNILRCFGGELLNMHDAIKRIRDESRWDVYE